MKKERLKISKKTYSELREKGRCTLFNTDDPDRIYNLSFKVTNPGLAEYLLIYLLNSKLPDFELGIDITSINFNPIQNRDDVKRKLHEAIENIV